MILAELQAVLGPGCVAAGAEAEARFLADWTAPGPVVPLAVVRPATTAGVAAALRLCNAAGVAVVPQGGRTGLAGGARPVAAAVVLSLERLAAPPAIDPLARLAVVEAGVTLQRLQEAATAEGLAFPVDLGARGSATIGGMISTNAGGIRAFRTGMMRANVLGLEVVLPDGTVLDATNRYIKNNTGYDLKQLFIGAEGTLGIVTRAVLRLTVRPGARAMALVRAPGLDAAHRVLRRLEGALGGLSACEIMWPAYYGFACGVTGTAPLAPGPGPVLLVEVEGRLPERLGRDLEEELGLLMSEGLLDDGVIARNEAQAAGFWAIREANEALYRQFPGLLGFDLSVLPAAMEPLVAAVARRIEAAGGGKALWFGHLGDLNLHLAAVPAAPLDAAAKTALAAAIHDEILAHGGSASAEHGIGREKRALLPKSRSAAEIALMRALHDLIDPRGVMNPGCLLP